MKRSLQFVLSLTCLVALLATPLLCVHILAGTGSHCAQSMSRTMIAGSMGEATPDSRRDALPPHKQQHLPPCCAVHPRSPVAESAPVVHLPTDRPASTAAVLFPAPASSRTAYPGPSALWSAAPPGSFRLPLRL